MLRQISGARSTVVAGRAMGGLAWPCTLVGSTFLVVSMLRSSDHRGGVSRVIRTATPPRFGDGSPYCRSHGSRSVAAGCRAMVGSASVGGVRVQLNDLIARRGCTRAGLGRTGQRTDGRETAALSEERSPARPDRDLVVSTRRRNRLVIVLLAGDWADSGRRSFMLTSRATSAWIDGIHEQSGATLRSNAGGRIRQKTCFANRPSQGDSACSGWRSWLADRAET